MNESKLIVIEQLPIIKSYLENLSVEIKEKVDRANSLVVNEETVKDVKQVRADLNKEFKELEEQRKQVKQAIMAKYDEFEVVYKENVSNLYKQADEDLKEKIDSVENELKLQKEMELREFAFEHINANNLQPVVKFENFNLNITLSASMKSLKDQIIKYIEKVNNDMELIKMEEYSNEIFVEYCKTHDFVNSKKIVIQRHEEINKIAEKETQLQINDNAEIVEAVEEVIAPVEIEEKIKVAFTITATKNQIRKLKTWLESEGIIYE